MEYQQKHGGTRWSSWLRHYATSRKVAGSIPDGVIRIFHSHNPSGRTMALELTQHLTEMSIRNISWGGKGGRCVGLTTLPSSCAYCLEIWEPQPPGTLRAYPGLKWDFLTFYQQKHTGRLKRKYRGADKSLARPGRKQATATQDSDVHISYL